MLCTCTQAHQVDFPAFPYVGCCIAHQPPTADPKSRRILKNSRLYSGLNTKEEESRNARWRTLYVSLSVAEGVHCSVFATFPFHCSPHSFSHVLLESASSLKISWWGWWGWVEDHRRWQSSTLWAQLHSHNTGFNQVCADRTAVSNPSKSRGNYLHVMQISSMKLAFMCCILSALALAGIRERIPYMMMIHLQREPSGAHK